MRKIKVFLGAFINKTNAQNLSCLALARHLDKSRFEVYTMSIYNGDLPIEEIEGVHVFNCFKPFKISGYLGFLWGICNADVVYLPRGEMFAFNAKLLKLLKRRSFKTIRNKLDDAALSSAVSIFKNEDNMKLAYSSCDRLYSTTPHMRDYNYQRFGIKSEEQVLYVTSDNSDYANPDKQVSSLKNVVFIGNDMIRKGIYDYLELAERFPNVTFHIVGSGQGKLNVEVEIKKRKLTNAIYHGQLRVDQMRELLKIIDLHIFPSRSEGLGKVTIETASAGVPSLLYSDYGARDWIESGKEGFVLDILDEMAEKINFLYQNPGKLQELSKGALELASKFDVKKLTHEYEKIIEDLYYHE